MFKMTTKRLAILSILLALGVVFKSVFSIGDGEFRISFFDIPLFLAGMIAGPFYGGLVALGTDLIYGLCFSPYPFSFIMIFTTIIWGVSGGLFYKKPYDNLLSLFIVVLATSLITTAINSIYLVIHFGFASMLAKLPLRIVALFCKWPVTTGLINLVYTKVFETKMENVWQFKKLEKTIKK